MAPRFATLILGTLLAVTGCSGGDGGNDTGAVERGSATPSGAGLSDRLRDGGLTIVLRHAATDPSRPDEQTVDLDDCSTQRNLSGKGRTDAQAIRTAIGRLDIPIGDIWASPYCRSRDTAKLAFGRFEVVNGLERLYPERDERADQRLNQLIRARAPHAGAPNLVIAGHGVYPSVLAPAVPLDEGEAALYARTNDGFELVDRIQPNEWAALGPYQSTPSATPTRVRDSVVSLEGPGGTGSAFRVALPDILVTSARLVADAGEVTVVRPDGSRLTARVLGRNRDVDIAALRLTGSRLPPLHSGTGLSEARKGDRAFAIGTSNAVTAGSIRTLSDPVTLDGGAEAKVIRIDAQVPRHSMGGPLVNDQGHVLGVLTMAADGSGVAIPVDAARNAAMDIVSPD